MAVVNCSVPKGRENYRFSVSAVTQQNMVVYNYRVIGIILKYYFDILLNYMKYFTCDFHTEVFRILNFHPSCTKCLYRYQFSLEHSLFKLNVAIYTLYDIIGYKIIIYNAL